MRVTLCSAVWQRHALAPIWWAGVQRIQRRFRSHGITMDVVVAGDEPRHERRARRAGATWVRIPNLPLGRKWNAAVETACLGDADYVLILGSDDFLADTLVDQYAALIHDGWLYVGLRGIYFYEPATGRRARYNLCGAEFGSPIGAGRLVHRSLLERLEYRPWLDCLNKRLDGDMAKRCFLPPAKLLTVEPGAVALDVKTEANIWTYETLAQGYAALEEVPHPRLAIPEWNRLAQLGKRRAA